MSNSEDTQILDQNQQDETKHQINADANNNNEYATNNEYESKPDLPAAQSEDGDVKEEAIDRHFDPEQGRKLFVGFGHAGFSEPTLQEFFSRFGSVERVLIKRDVMTGKPRGFAFITMSSQEETNEILRNAPQDIEGKSVDIKMAKSRPISKKVFVGGIDGNLSQEEIRNYFSQFGNVCDLELPFDRVNNKRRQFCFVIFDSEQAANLASSQPKQQIYGRTCDVKKATPQPIAQQQKRQASMHHSFNGSYQSNAHSLVDSRNARFYGCSPSSISPSSKSVQLGHRGGYRSNSRSDGHRNSFSGRRSVDSQYGGHHDRFSNLHGYRKNGPPPHRQSERSAGRQIATGGQYQSNAVNGAHHPAKNYNGHHKVHPQQPQQQPQQPQMQGQYYDQLGQQQAGFYGFGMPYEYYPQQFSQHQAHANQAGGNQYMHGPADYFNQFAVNFYQQQQQSQQSAALQQQPQQQYNPNAMNAFYPNYQSTNPTLDNATGPLMPAPQGQQGQPGQLGQPGQPGQPQQMQPLQQVPTTVAGDYQSLDERYYQEQQKQFENNLINASSYKFGGSQDEINYQQMINHNNLLNVPFQGSLQQC